MQAGDFSAYLANNCPGAANLGRGAFGPGVIAPNGRLTLPLSPAALAIASRRPQSGDPCGSVFTGNILRENQLQVPLRIDYQATKNNSIFFRYLATGIDTAVPYELSPGDVLTASGIGTDDLAQSFTGGLTTIVNPRIVNSFRVFVNDVRTNHPGARYFGPQDVGINAYTYVDQSLPLANCRSHSEPAHRERHPLHLFMARPSGRSRLLLTRDNVACSLHSNN